MKQKWMICPICRGEGSHVNPNIDAHGLTAEDFNDRDFQESYHRGDYDVQCKTCNGSGKILKAEWKSKRERLAKAAEDRRLAAREDGDYEAYRVAHDWRYGD